MLPMIERFENVPKIWTVKSYSFDKLSIILIDVIELAVSKAEAMSPQTMSVHISGHLFHQMMDDIYLLSIFPGKQHILID